MSKITRAVVRRCLGSTAALGFASVALPGMVMQVEASALGSHVWFTMQVVQAEHARLLEPDRVEIWLPHHRALALFERMAGPFLERRAGTGMVGPRRGLPSPGSEHCP